MPHLWPEPYRQIGPIVCLWDRNILTPSDQGLTHYVGVLINTKCCVMRNKGPMFELSTEKGANFVSRE